MSDYRLDTSTGIIYTWEEWWENWAQAIGDAGVVGSAYDKLPEVDIEGLDIEEVRRKMIFIYKRPDLKQGDLIRHNMDDIETYVVTQVIDGDIYCYNMENGSPKKWIGSFVRMGTAIPTSALEVMKAQQIMYNTAMNKLNGSINNSIDHSVPPLNNVGGNDL